MPLKKMTTDIIFLAPSSLFDIYVESARLLFRANMVERASAAAAITPDAYRVSLGTWCSLPPPALPLFDFGLGGWDALARQNTNPRTAVLFKRLLEGTGGGCDLVSFLAAARTSSSPPRVAVVAADTHAQIESGLRSLADSRRFFNVERGCIVQRAVWRPPSSTDWEEETAFVRSAVKRVLPVKLQSSVALFGWSPENNDGWLESSIVAMARRLATSAVVVIAEPAVISEATFECRPWLRNPEVDEFLAAAGERTAQAFRVSLFQLAPLAALALCAVGGGAPRDSAFRNAEESDSTSTTLSAIAARSES